MTNEHNTALAVETRGLAFAYPVDSGEPAFEISWPDLRIDQGTFCVVVGSTGSGKTTLLRSPELVPAGAYRGWARVLGRVASGEGVRGEQTFTALESAQSIGFVMQDTAAQIVCDTVWHELAFGLENVGMPQNEMRRRVAEVAHFFGIEPWVRKKTEDLSGGQKQIVNLASVLALRPRVLLLDEPTAQLDPNAVVVDLGADHRLEEQAAWDEFYGGDFYEHWTYGMPELIVGTDANGTYLRQRSALPGTKRIAGPGCNVTATTLAMQPGIAQGLVEPKSIVADLVVGYSGAGKNLKRTNLLAAEALQAALPYGVGGTHRHIPEILQNFAHAAGRNAADAKDFTLSFTPVLAPMSRGILATVSATMSEKAKAMTDAQIREAWTTAYEDQDFMVVLPEGMLPSTGNIIGSNAAHLQVVTDRNAGRIIAFAAIDNLNRGTAGQAVQSLNIALGLPEDQGLTKIGVAP